MAVFCANLSLCRTQDKSATAAFSSYPLLACAAAYSALGIPILGFRPGVASARAGMAGGDVIRC